MSTKVEKVSESKRIQINNINSILEALGYTLFQEIGEGSFSKVFLAKYISKRKQLDLACKMVDANAGPNNFTTKFLPRELKILVQLKHPHIIHTYSIFKVKSNWLIFMQYAKNGDVFEYMLENGALDEDLARYWFRQLSLALQYLHKLGITHRDLKCENALITEKYNVKLSDFSFARYTFDNKGAPALSSTFCGSFPYISPEIIRGRLYDPKCADVWALGVLLFIMLNKSLPYSESNLKKLYEKQMKQDWRFRSKRDSLLSKEVKYLVRRMLTPKCSNRWDIDRVVNSDWVMKDSNIKMLAPDEQRALDEAIILRSDKSYIQSSTCPMKARKKVKVEGAQMSKMVIGSISIIKEESIGTSNNSPDPLQILRYTQDMVQTEKNHSTKNIHSSKDQLSENIQFSKDQAPGIIKFLKNQVGDNIQTLKEQVFENVQFLKNRGNDNTLSSYQASDNIQSSKDQTTDNIESSKEQINENIQSSQDQVNENIQFSKVQATDNIQYSKDQASDNIQSSQDQVNENTQFSKVQATDNIQSSEGQATDNIQSSKDKVTDNIQS